MKKLDKSEKERIGKFVIAGSVVVIAVVFILQWQLRGGVKYDEENLCPKNQPYPHCILLFDRTDPLTDSQKAFVKRYMRKVKTELKLHEKLSIYVIDEQGDKLSEPIFSMCNPGSGEMANELYQNPRMIERKFNEFFGTPLEKAIESLQALRSQGRTPLLEILNEIAAIESLRTDPLGTRLIVISDMMHNTEEFSHYKERAEFRKFVNSPYGKQIMADLHGMNVEILYLLRSDLRIAQTPQHLSFWEQYFAECGAQLTSVQRVR